MNTMFGWMTVIKYLAATWAMVGIGALLGIACLVIGFYLAPLRQLFAGLAVACFVATLAFTFGVKMEKQVWEARAALADKLRMERDELEEKAAKDDEARTEAGLAEVNRKEDESNEEYAKRLASRPKGSADSCALTDDDLR